jgi:hypothetical protein
LESSIKESSDSRGLGAARLSRDTKGKVGVEIESERAVDNLSGERSLRRSRCKEK